MCSRLLFSTAFRTPVFCYIGYKDFSNLKEDKISAPKSFPTKGQTFRPSETLEGFIPSMQATGMS